MATPVPSLSHYPLAQPWVLTILSLVSISHDLEDWSWSVI